MGLFGGSVKKLEQSGDVYGLVKRLLDSDGHLGEVRSIGIVAALGRLGSSAVPPLLLALDEGHPGVPAALARIGEASLAGLAGELRQENPQAQRGAALAILIMAAHRNEISEEALDALKFVKDSSPYFAVVVFAVAALGAHYSGGRSVRRMERYVEAERPRRALIAEEDPAGDESSRWVLSAARLAYPQDPDSCYQAGDALIYARVGCKKAAKVS